MGEALVYDTGNNIFQYATIYTPMAYLTPSQFRIKAVRIFSMVKTLLQTHSAHRSWHVQFIACDYLLTES